MKIRIAFLAAVAALFSSCLPVPFDLALSQSAATASRMTQDNSGLLTLDQFTDPSAHDFIFYPQILATGPDYGAGFVVSARGLDVSFSAVQRNPSSGTYNSYSSQSFTMANPDPHAQAFFAWPLKTGSSYVLGFGFDAVDPLNGNGFAVMQGDPVGHTLTQLPAGSNGMHSFLQTTMGLDAVVLGASMSADPFGTYDMFHWLGTQNGSPGNWMEFAFQVSSGGLAFPPSPTPRGGLYYPLSFIPSGVSRVLFFYDENQGGDPNRSPNRSFGSWWDDPSGSWVTYAWWGPPGSAPTQSARLPISHRLDAFLSTGQLLSTEGGTGRLYDRDGNQLATFPLGNLVYMGEEYVGGIARCYFSQCLLYDNKVHFNVYWIRTDQLNTLAN
jgi:hypothetical protein